MYARNTWVNSTLAVTGVLALLTSLWAAQSPTAEQLGGNERHLAFVSTDKPLYKPGEAVYVRTVVLHAATRKPLAGQAHGMVEILGPKGDVVGGGSTQCEEGVFGFSWPVPPEQAGGEYTVKISFPNHGFPPSERKFDVRAYRAPRLKSQIKFVRDGYGPGDEVAAMLHTERAEGGIPAGAKVRVSALVDGETAYQGETQVDAAGNASTRFALPGDIRRGEGTLVMAIEDGGVVETASKTIPILLQTVDLTLYPEGGDLVAGIANRVYLEAFTPAKKPADLAGVVLDGQGAEAGTFRTDHEGRGRFVLTPKAGEKYELKINEPAGIKTRYPLPEVKNAGVVLSSVDNVTAAGAPVKLSVAAAAAGEYIVTLSQREKEIAREKKTLKAGEAIEVALAGEAEGILTATVWNAKNEPVAERLVFRAPKQAVQVKFSPDQKSYVPGGTAKIKVETKNEKGEPISAVVGVNVTDDSVLEMIEKREQRPSLPVMVLLENDVRELADAHVYFDAANPQAPLAVDLLLGTQGWRRFALVNLENFLAEHGDAGRRALAVQIVTIRETLKNSGRLFEFDGAFPAAPQAAAPAPADAAAAVGGEPVNKAPGFGGPVDEFSAKSEAAPDESKVAAEPAIEEAAKPAAGPVAADDADFAEGQGQAAAARSLGDLRANAGDGKLRRALERADAKADRDQLFRKEQAQSALRQDLVAVRVYAHSVRADRQPGDRRDFAETLYWAAGVKTNDRGEATIEFGLNDAVSSFRISGDAFSASGGLGAGSLTIDSVQPFYVEPKLPLEVTSNDKPRVPVSVVNGTQGGLTAGKFTVTAQTPVGVRTSEVNLEPLAPGARVRKLLGLNVGKFNGDAELTITASAGGYGDKVTRKFKVRPLGFPQEVARGGLVSPSETITQEISIPESLVRGSLETRIVVYPTPLASMTEALERLIQEPCGCFEQTSSSTYPLVMAQQYFKSHQGVDPSIIERASRTLETGYQRLLGFECKGGGFEWFGQDPGHDALTAYGLLEFSDMAQVREVDANMLERTRKWLLAQRDGKGGYARKTHTLHTWLAEPELASTYNSWALLEAQVDADMAKEVAFAREAGEKAQNTYVTALAANALALAGDKEGSDHLLDKLAGKQQENGSLKDATQSVVGSGGEALEIETTALAVTAWLKNPSYAENVEKSIKYLAESCKSGRYGSTQSTVLALRAIVAYDKSRAKPKAPGTLQLVIDDQPLGEPVAFTADTSGAITLPSASALMTPGVHKVQIRMTGGSQMPYSVAAKFYNEKPASSENCKMHLTTKLAHNRVKEGEATEVRVTVVNRTGEVLPTPMAIVGIPGGLEVRHDQLKELVKSGKIAAYEVLGREVALYWRSFDKEERVELPVSVIAAVPGTYSAPASRTYLYYTDEHKHWVDGVTVEIDPAE